MLTNKLMKRLSLYVFLALFFCNSVFAETKWITKKDKEPPIIQIPSTIKVNSYNYIIKGKAFDKGTDEFYMELDGVIIPIKKGKFTIKRFSKVDEKLKIIAIDKYGNRSEKIVKIIIDIPVEKTTTVVEKPELEPNLIETDKIKPIIDIENEFTFNDAEYVLTGKVKDKGGSKNLYLFVKKGNEKRS